MDSHEHHQDSHGRMPRRRALKVYSSRPGKRMWVGDPLSGVVSSTLKFSIDGLAPALFFQGVPRKSKSQNVDAISVKEDIDNDNEICREQDKGNGGRGSTSRSYDIQTDNRDI
jgi:hypothetical protein